MTDSARPARPPGSLATEAYVEIRQRILSCELAPGRSITERGLAAELGLGVTPIREALARLRFDGLVLSIPRAGYVVTPITVKDIDDVFDIWRFLAPAVVELAFPRLSVGDYEALQRASAETVRWRELDHGSAAEWIDNSESVFRLLVRAAANPRLEEVFQRIAGDLQRIFTLILRDSSAAGFFSANNSTLNEHLLARDLEGAIAEVHRSITEFHAVIRDYVLNSAAVQQAHLSAF